MRERPNRRAWKAREAQASVGSNPTPSAICVRELPDSPTDSVARRKGARAAEWDGLENRCGCMPTVGSNPTPSAKRPQRSDVTATQDNQRTLLVTGVGGFIGSAVARRLVAEGFRVVGVDDFSVGKRSNVPDQVDLIEADVAAPQLVSKLPAAVHAVLHLAGQSSGEISFDDPVSDLQKNTISTLQLINYANSAGATRFVFASSMSVYGAVDDTPTREDAVLQPLSCYGVGKAAAEGYLRVFSQRTPFVSLRMFNVYGPGQDLQNLRQGMVSIYLAQALATKRIVVKGSAERYRDFVYIDDVVEAWVRALQRPELLNTAINVGSGIRTEVGQLLSMIQQLVPGTTVEFTDGTPGDQFGIYADTQHMHMYLGLSHVVSLQDGLRKFAEKVQLV